MARRPAGRRSPYADLPRAAFWRSAMRAPDEATVAALYRPKFDLTPQTRLMTAGSCFAQHLHRTLTRAGWNVLQGEGTGRLLPAALARDYGYNIYSARYGNIYTARQLRQLIEDALSDTPRPAPVWTRDGRVFDALRPTVEPHGLDSADLVQEARRDHLACVRGVLAETDVLIFTLGLTECWIDRTTGLALPTAPGTVAGQYDPDTVTFHNFTYPEVLADLCASRDLLHAAGYPVRILLTVSPVPLTATASGAHVGTATTYSKSVLRAVCGVLEAQDPDFDYFPLTKSSPQPPPVGPISPATGAIRRPPASIPFWACLPWPMATAPPPKSPPRPNRPTPARPPKRSPEKKSCSRRSANDPGGHHREFPYRRLCRGVTGNPRRVSDG